MKAFIMNVDKNLKELRARLGMTQLKFALAIGMTPTTIAKYETGERLPPIKTILKIIKLAKKHGIDIRIEDIYSE